MPFLHHSRHIRELRMGAPKSYKTGSVVESYPTPMLVLEFDQDGLDVVVKRAVTKVKPDELKTLLLKKPEDLPPVTEIAYYSITRPQVTDEWVPQSNQATFKNIMWNFNALANSPTMPFKTVVLDGGSKLQDFMLQYMPESKGDANATGKAMTQDARKWAYAVGFKFMQVCSTLYSLPCHVVVLIHVTIEKNEVTSEIQKLPLIYGKDPKYNFPGIPSQVFFQDIELGKPVLYTKSVAYCKGLGARWPQNLPNKIDTDFASVYEKEYKQ